MFLTSGNGTSHCIRQSPSFWSTPGSLPHQSTSKAGRGWNSFQNWEFPDDDWFKHLIRCGSVVDLHRRVWGLFYSLADAGKQYLTAESL